jgi:hypothetical protein
MCAFFKINLDFKRLKSSFFLKKYTPCAETLKLLKNIYPTVNWNHVDFYEGLPWFTPLVAPYVTAQALPDFYSCSRFRIYLSKFDETKAQCISDIVHEAFHVLQGMHFAKGYGVGFFRIWMVYYIAFFIKYGYRQNPFEIPAYDQEYRFLEYCRQKGFHGISPRVSYKSFSDIFIEKELVFRDIDFSFGENILLLFVGILLCALITILKPVADVLMYSVRLFLK